MAIYAIIQQPSTHAEKLAPAIEAAFKGSILVVRDGVWLVAASGTAEDVSNKIGIITTEESGAAIVLEAASYFGRANPAIWSWIKANWEARPVG